MKRALFITTGLILLYWLFSDARTSSKAIEKMTGAFSKLWAALTG